MQAHIERTDDPTRWWAVPQALTDISHWVGWRWVERDGRITKVPIDPRTGNYAKVNDPTSWGSLQQAEAAVGRFALDGIGLVLDGSEGLVGIDLDRCIDPHTDAIADWASEIVALLASYTEVTPSGAGLRVWVRGVLPPGGRRVGHVELYDRDRYFTVTGDPTYDSPRTVEARQAEIEALHARLFPTVREPLTVARSYPLSTLDDVALVEKAKGARSGAKFTRLWSGDITGYGSHSEADLALCGMLLYWTDRDVSRADQLFRCSGLYRPKWDAPDGRGRTYGSRTLDAALKQR